MRAPVLMLVLLAAAVLEQNSNQHPEGQSLKGPAESSPAHAQSRGVLFWRMDRHAVDFLLDRVPQSDLTRLAQLHRTFVDLQCEGELLREQPEAGGRNLLCTLPASQGESRSGIGSESEPGTILFIAHYEHDGPGRSAIEDWSGAIMLPFLYHALAAAPRNHTFLFAEVDGESGAKVLFESLAHGQRRDIQGVIALDALGLGPVRYYTSSNDTNNNAGWSVLPQTLLDAAIDEGAPEPTAAPPGTWFKIDDTRQFRHSGIPCIVVHSVNWNARHLPGTVHDSESAINGDTYYNTVTLLAGYAAELDRGWPSFSGPSASPSPGGRRR